MNIIRVHNEIYHYWYYKTDVSVCYGLFEAFYDRSWYTNYLYGTRSIAFDYYNHREEGIEFNYKPANENNF